MLYFDRKIDDFTKTMPFNTAGFLIGTSNSKQLVCDKNGKLWFINLCICNYSPLEGKFIHYIPKETYNRLDSLSYAQLPSRRANLTNINGSEIFFTDNKNNFWFLKGNDLYEYVSSIDNFKMYGTKDKLYPTCPTNRFDGEVFLIGGTNQLFSFAFSNKQFNEIKLDCEIGNIYTSKEPERNLLLICASTGLYKGLRDTRQSIVKLTKINNLPFRIICQLENSSFLIGGDRGLSILSNDYKTIKKADGEGAELIINSIFKAVNNDIYVGTDKGLLLFKTGRGIIKWWKPNPNKKGQLAGEKVISIAQTPDGSIWLASDKCILKLNADNETFTNYLEPSHSDITGGLLSAISTDSKGYLWVGETSGFGLNRINTKTGYIDHYLNVPWDSTSMRKGDINAIFESSDGKIWIGSTTALSLFIPKTNSFVHYDSKSSLGVDGVKAISEDSHKNLWISTSKGISKFNPISLKCENFTWRDGLQDGDFSERCAIKLRNGKLLFGGMEGYNMFYPDSIKLNPYKPKPLISSIKINGEVRFISTPKFISLNPQERNIEFSFSCSDFNAPQSNKLKYILEGFSKDWVTVEKTNNLATFTNLPYGSYRFKVRATNNDGLWCAEPIICNFKIEYPFWFKWWGVLVEIALLSIFIYLIIKYRVKTLEQQKHQLEKEVGNRTKEITLKNEKILTQNELLQKQKEHIHFIHNQIADSIEYTQYLQDSYFLTPEQKKDILGENFLIFLPKEKLSGDFLWAVPQGNSSIFAIVDCIGHGVPGALISMLGLTLLREVSLSYISDSPDIVLKRIHNRLLETLKDHKQETMNLNTLDIGYCVLNREKGELQFAGSHISLYISRFNASNGKETPAFEEFRADKKQLGNPLQDDNYTLHIIPVLEGDVIYIFTDGFVDQYSKMTKEKYSRARAKELFQKMKGIPLEIQREIILSSIYEWKGETDQTDDITIHGIKI